MTVNHIKKCLLLLLAVLLLCSCGVQDTPAPDPQPAPAESCTIGGSFTATVRDVLPDYCLDDTTPLVAVVTAFQSPPFTVYVGEELGKKLLEEQAMPRYNMRDDRLASMTDESVDRFFTCILCQSFAPAHCCVVTPERLGLCGAVSWLDAKATKELDPAGPCQPILKEGCTDEKLGRYASVDEAVNKYSHGALEHVTLYSLFQDPMTSCGCFECICGIEPCSMGVVITCREYAGITPLGMTFSEMASMTGGGVQTPGFMGHGKHYIASHKFLKAEGGVGRLVWLPKELKDQIRDKLNETAKDMYDIDNFADMVADETNCPNGDPEELLAFLSEVGHPVLSMDPLDI